MKKVFVAAVAIVLVAVCVGTWALRHQRQARIATNIAAAGKPGRAVNPAQGPQVSRAMESLARLPLSFEEEGKSAGSEKRFVSRGPGYALGIAGSGANLIRKYRMPENEGNPAAMAMGLPFRGLSNFRLTWTGANPAAKPVGGEKQPGESNYLNSSDRSKWRRHVAHYGNVKIASLYPGVDLLFHGDRKQLEFDYVVAPGADASAIKMDIGTPSLVGLNEKGQLEILDGGDRLVLEAPLAYQQIGSARQMVNAQYVLAEGHKVKLALGNYDKKRELVIDPVLSFAAHFGSSTDSTLATDVALDASGDIYLTGRTCDVDYPVTSGVLQPTGGTIGNALCDTGVITKLDATASTLIYSTYIGSQNNVTSGIRILPVSGGPALVAGVTTATDFPTTSNAFQQVAGGGTCTYGPMLLNRPCTDSFLLELSGDGSSLVFSTYLGGDRADLISSMTVDSTGNIYVGGGTNSDNFPATNGTVQTTLGGGTCQSGLYPCFDGFVAKFNSTGSQLLAATLLGGNDDDFISGVALDTSGNIYVGGTAYSTNFPTTAGSFQPIHSAGPDQGDAFVAKLTSNMSTLTYSTFVGGTGFDLGLALKVDSTGAAYITGSTNSTDFPTVTGSFQTTYAGPATTTCDTAIDPSLLDQPTCGDIFVSKLNPAGTALVYSTYIGGSGQDIAFNEALDSSNNLWLLANTGSTDFPYTSNAYYTSNGDNVALVELSADGKTVPFATPLAEGNAGQALALGLTIDAADEVYVAGQATTFSPTPGTFSSGTTPSIFLAKFVQGTAQPAVTLSATSLNFSGVTNSATAPQSVTLTNSGTGMLHLAISLSTSSIGTGDPQAFSESDNCPASIPAGGTCTINAIYLPTGASSSDGAVITILDDAPGAPHSVSLTGSNGLTTSSSFVPGSLSFPGQQPGVASASQNSGLSSQSGGANNISAKITALPILSGPNAAEFNVDESQCVIGSGCFVTVIFTPAVTATGTRTATLTVPSTAPNSPHTLALSGTVATGPFAVLLPSPITLNAVTVGQAGPIQTLFVHNTGGGTLNVTGFNITGADASEFVISTGSCGPALTLPPQGICFVNLVLTPAAPGNRTATITLADNETTPASTTVTGMGATSGGPQLSSAIFGNPIFSDTTVGQNTSFFSQPMVTLTNSGTGANAAAHVTNVSLTGTGDFMIQGASTCVAGFLLAANNGGCSVSVFFAPSAVGLRNGMLTIQTDAPGAPSFSYNFSGNGVQTAGVLLTPNTLNFGKEVVGGTTTVQPVTLKNTGNGPLNISGLAISGPFSQTTTCGASLAAGASCAFSIKFSPTVFGSGGGTLTFTGNAAGGLYAVGLNGQGTTGPVGQLTPATLSFSSQPIGSTSAAQTVSLTNVGDTAFTFSGLQATENYTATSNCPGTLSAGASCAIMVRFAPTLDTFQGGATPGAVYVTTSAPGSPLTIPASGLAIASTGAPTAPTIVSSVNPSILGQPVTFTATVTSTSPGTPTGTITFMEANGALGPAVTMSGGQASLTTSALAAGFNSIFVVYSGDATFAPSTSSGFVQTVNAATSTAVVSSLNPSSVGQNVTFTATVTSATAGTITGDIVFFDGANQISNPVLISGGSAALSITTLAQGPHSITAKYAGSTTYAPSTSPAITQTVNAGTTASTTTAVASSLNPSTTGASVTFTATVSSTTAGTITGTATFLDGATSLGAGAVGAGGKATFSTSALTQGSHSITAQYGGNTNFAASTSPALTQTVNAGTKASTTAAIASSLNPSTTGASVTFTATVSSATAGTITGTVTFLDGATTLGTGTVGAGGAATFMTSSLSVGSHMITAQYGGDANYVTSTSPVITQVVATAADFGVSATPTSLTLTAGQTGTVAFTITPQNGSTQTVMFSCTGLPAASACGFMPASVTLDGTHAQTTQVMISTTARTAAARASSAGNPPLFGKILVGWTHLGAMLGLLAIGFAGIFGLSLYRPRTAAMRAALVLLVLAIPMAALMSCSNAPPASGGGGTPAGTSQVSITAISGNDSHVAPVMLTVN